MKTISDQIAVLKLIPGKKYIFLVKHGMDIDAVIKAGEAIGATGPVVMVDNFDDVSAAVWSVSNRLQHLFGTPFMNWVKDNLHTLFLQFLEEMGASEAEIEEQRKHMEKIQKQWDNPKGKML